MCRSAATWLTVSTAVMLACAELCTAKDNEQTATAKDSPRGVSSEQVVLNDVVYSLEADGNQLFLTSKRLESAERRIQRAPLKFSPDGDSRTVELSLAVMGKKNLMAVVKTRRNQEHDFYCLTWIGPPSTEPATGKFAFYSSKFYSTQRNFKILAISGKHATGTALVVLGDIPLPDAESDGVIYFSGCPWPPNDGLLQSFRARPAKGE